MTWLRDRFLFCCGWRWGSRWCWLDVLTGCKFRTICDRHDRAITGPLDEHWSRNKFDRLMAAGEPVEITPGPRPILAALPAWTDDAIRLWGEDWYSPEDAIYDAGGAAHDADAGRDA